MFVKTTLFAFLFMLTSAVAFADSPSSLDKTAFEAYNSHNYLAALNNWSKAASQGDAEAQFHLCVLYYNGQGVLQNYSTAANWCTKAAFQGYATAQYRLGLLYENGRGVNQDYSIAIEWFTKAALQGLVDAQVKLGTAYLKGNIVPQDYAKAAKWFTKAAQLGDAESQINLGYLYFKGNGVLQNFTRAAYWYTKAAQQGNARAQLVLGDIYTGGFGVQRNYITGYKWYVLVKATATPGSDIETSASHFTKELLFKMTPAEVNQAQQEAADWFKKYQKKSKADIPVATPQLMPPKPDINAHPSQPINYLAENYYLQQVLGPNGHIDKTLHDQFWQQFNGESEHDLSLTINWIKGSLLATQEFETELWKSALLSYNNHQVIKTERLIQLEKEVPEMAKKSLPWPPGSPQYTEILASFNSGWKTSVEDAKRLLNAVASHKPFTAVNGTEVQLNKHTIEQALSSIDASIIRLNKLLDRNWNGS